METKQKYCIIKLYVSHRVYFTVKPYDLFETLEDGWLVVFYG